MLLKRYNKPLSVSTQEISTNLTDFLRNDFDLWSRDISFYYRGKECGAGTNRWGEGAADAALRCQPGSRCSPLWSRWLHRGTVSGVAPLHTPGRHISCQHTHTLNSECNLHELVGGCWKCGARLWVSAWLSRQTVFAAVSRAKMFCVLL